jgi:hypothetical protein
VLNINMSCLNSNRSSGILIGEGEILIGAAGILIGDSWILIRFTGIFIGAAWIVIGAMEY